MNQDFSKSKLKETIKVGYTSLDKADFVPDVEKLTLEPEYLKSAKLLLDNNSLRNFYAHRLRLIWWDNQNSKDYCFKRGLIDSLNGKGQDRWTTHLREIFFDAQKYQQEIKNAKLENIIGSGEILQQNHDTLAKFLNDTFKLVNIKLEKDL